MLRIARTIEAPPERVWQLIADTESWPAWGPSITAVEAPTRRIQLGTRGRVRTKAGFWLPFEISELEEGSSWRWRVAGIPATGHRVETAGEERARIVFEVPLAAAPYSVVCALAARRIARLCT